MLLGLRSGFGKVTGYKVNIHKSWVFLQTSREQLEQKLKYKYILVYVLPK